MSSNKKPLILINPNMIDLITNNYNEQKLNEYS